MSNRYAMEPVTGVRIEQEILRLLGLLEDQTHDLATLARDAAEKEVIHKRDYARKFMSSAGSIPAKTHQAEILTSEKRLKRELAAALVASQKEAIATTRAQIDALRTLSANVRAQT